MVILPAHLKGLTLYPAYGRIVLDENMTKIEVMEAQKIHPEIKWNEPEMKKKKRK